MRFGQKCIPGRAAELQVPFPSIRTELPSWCFSPLWRWVINVLWLVIGCCSLSLPYPVRSSTALNGRIFMNRSIIQGLDAIQLNPGEKEKNHRCEKGYSQLTNKHTDLVLQRLENISWKAWRVRFPRCRPEAKTSCQKTTVRFPKADGYQIRRSEASSAALLPVWHRDHPSSFRLTVMGLACPKSTWKKTALKTGKPLKTRWTTSYTVVHDTSVCLYDSQPL